MNSPTLQRQSAYRINVNHNHLQQLEHNIHSRLTYKRILPLLWIRSWRGKSPKAIARLSNFPSTDLRLRPSLDQRLHGDKRTAINSRRPTHGDQPTAINSRRLTHDNELTASNLAKTKTKTKKRLTPGHELIKTNSKQQTHANEYRMLISSTTNPRQSLNAIQHLNVGILFVFLYPKKKRKKNLVSVLSDLNSTISWQRGTSWT